jgi:hypothetical protein
MQSHPAVSPVAPAPPANTDPEPEADAHTLERLAVLCDLASIVGEDGRAVVRRVVGGLVKGNRRAYEAHLNRLSSKFIASIEPRGF